MEYSPTHTDNMSQPSAPSSLHIAAEVVDVSANEINLAIRHSA